MFNSCLVAVIVPGLMLTFYSGVYGTCIGATREFKMVAKGLIGLSGVFIGIGEILGECGNVCSMQCKRAPTADKNLPDAHSMPNALLWVVVGWMSEKGVEGKAKTRIWRVLSDVD